MARSMIPIRQRVGFPDGLFDAMLRSPSPVFAWADQPPTWTPTVDIDATQDRIVLRADLPGVAKEDLSLQIHDGQLFLKGSRREPSRDEDDQVIRAERSFGDFERVFRLSRNIDAERIDARYENGVLEVHMRMREAAKPKTVDIK